MSVETFIDRCETLLPIGFDPRQIALSKYMVGYVLDLEPFLSLDIQNGGFFCFSIFGKTTFLINIIRFDRSLFSFIY